ncbi:MAG TPA: polyprenyl synthetase family protein [Candidatus Atribacteria bacterium]|nr:polyprenyl synthetase family protein [Candidatus Atribacteria bacterium]
MDFQSLYDYKKELVNTALKELIDKVAGCHGKLLDSVKYSLFAGGKRLRPILLLSANELVEDDNEDKMHLACAVEMIHTYSLIHDDLPAMDNDEYRRGMLTNHMVYGEAMAILAGDALLNLAYETMIRNIPAELDRMQRYLKAVSVIASASGMSGMIGGQAADIDNGSVDKTEDVLNYIHQHKTEALITASLYAGMLLSDHRKELLEPVIAYGKAIGLAFQITDDILDVTGDITTLGKKPGSDEKNRKLTYPGRFGLEGSRRMAERLIDEAVTHISVFGKRSEFLKCLAYSILERTQ